MFLTASRRHLAGVGGGLEGGEDGRGRRDPRPSPGAATAPPCAAPKPRFQTKGGEPRCSHASRTAPKAGVNSQRCSLWGARRARSGAARGPGPHARSYLATLRRGSGEGHPGVERHAAPVGAAVPVELPAQGQVGCGEREGGREAGREGGRRQCLSPGRAGPGAPRSCRCPWPCPLVPPGLPGSESATVAHLGSLFIPVPHPPPQSCQAPGIGEASSPAAARSSDEAHRPMRQVQTRPGGHKRRVGRGQTNTPEVPTAGTNPHASAPAQAPR